MQKKFTVHHRLLCLPCPYIQEGKTPLHYACMCGSVGLVSALLERDPSREFVDTQDRHGDTALHVATRLCFKVVVKQLLACKANKEILNQVNPSACILCS